MGYWLILFILLFVGVVVVDNAFDTDKKKLPYYGLLGVVFFTGIGWGWYDWQRHTLADYQISPSYLVLYYATGETEHITYQDIENIKFFVRGKTNSYCGLSFYIKGKDNLRTLSNFQCDDIRNLQSQITQKISVK